MTTTISQREPVSLSKHDRDLAEKCHQQLVVERESANVFISDGQSKTIVELPPSVLELLIELLRVVSEGNAVTLVPIHAELTTQQASDLLGVSRPFLVNALESGAMPYRRVGTHRRVKFEDVMKYKHATMEARRMTLDELVADGQELGMDD